MTSKDVLNYIEKEGIEKLYKKMEKYFTMIDEISDKLIEGDLLGEYDLAYFHDRLQGIYAKFYPIAQVLESYRDSKRADSKIQEHDKLEKYRTQDSTILNAKADANVKEIDKYYRDFNSYAQTCSQLAIGCQARMKRLSVDKGLKNVDFTGDTSKIPQEKNENNLDQGKVNKQEEKDEGWES